MHFLKITPSLKRRHSEGGEAMRGSGEREREREKAPEQIHSAGLFIPGKKKKKLMGETMSVEMRRYSIFVSHDRLIHHGNELRGLWKSGEVNKSR